MGFWQHGEYEDFVKAHADSRQRMELLHPPGDPFDPDYPGILVGYDSMPDWMDFSDLITLDNSDKHLTRANEVHFKVLLQAYRTDRANYIRDVKSRLRQVKGRRTGMALLAEIDATLTFRASHGNWPEGVVPRGANAIVKGADANRFLHNVQHVDMPPVSLIENFRSSQRAFYDALARLPPGQPKYIWVREYDLDRSLLLQKQQGGLLFEVSKPGSGPPIDRSARRRRVADAGTASNRMLDRTGVTPAAFAAFPFNDLADRELAFDLLNLIQPTFDNTAGVNRAR